MKEDLSSIPLKERMWSKQVRSDLKKKGFSKLDVTPEEERTYEFWGLFDNDKYVVISGRFVPKISDGEARIERATYLYDIEKVTEEFVGENPLSAFEKIRIAILQEEGWPFLSTDAGHFLLVPVEESGRQIA